MIVLVTVLEIFVVIIFLEENIKGILETVFDGVFRITENVDSNRETRIDYFSIIVLDPPNYGHIREKMNEPDPRNDISKARILDIYSDQGTDTV